MTGRPDTKNGEGLSFETLLVASISSAIAAIVVSQFWQGGTPIAAALTPVIVALVSEGLRRPIRSELVRRPVRRGTGASGEEPRVEEPPPYRVYSSGGERAGGLRERLSGRRVRLALVTGVLAFVAAALVLTLPELIFGGSVSGSDRNTTFFGGGGGDRDDEDERDEDGREEPAPTPSPGSPPGSAPIPDDDASPPADAPPSEEPPPPDTTPSPGAPVPQPPPETPTQTEP